MRYAGPAIPPPPEAHHAKAAQPPPPGSFAVDLLAAPILPVFAIKRGWRTMRLLPAYGVHLLGLALAMVVYAILDVILYGNTYFIEDLLDELGYIFFSGNSDHLIIGFAGLVLTALLFESAYLVIAWVLMPWGASPESWRRSMNRGLIRLLQLTPFHALSLVALIIVMQWIDEHRTYNYSYSRSTYGSGWIGYEAAQLLQAVCVLTYLASQVIVTLWAMAVHHERPHWAAHSPWPAVCEGCGYQLVGMSAGQTCPECGAPVEHSFKSPRAQDDKRGLFDKMLQATCRPYTFGKTIPLYRPSTGHRGALWVGTCMLLATPVIGLIIDQGEIVFDLDDLTSDYGSISTAYVITAAFTVIGSLAAGLLGATLWGVYARLFRRRNALYPAAQAFAYQSGFFSLWALGYYQLMALVIIAIEHMWSGQGATPAWFGFLPLVFPAYTLAMMVFGFTLQGRLLAGARYGNG